MSVRSLIHPWLCTSEAQLVSPPVPTKQLLPVMGKRHRSPFHTGQATILMNLLWCAPLRRRGVTADRLLGGFNGHAQLLCFLRGHDRLSHAE